MKLLDANILIYAVNVDAPLHGAAKSWIEEVLSEGETVAFSWIVILAFLRLSTRPGLFRNPLAPHEAFDVIHSWLDHPEVTIVNPGPDHFGVLERILGPLGTAGNLTSDAHLAAIAIENGAELCSCDADFARFAGLKWRNPLKHAHVRLKSK
jgi:toxin-antitoxin system PIN domain toxin